MNTLSWFLYLADVVGKLTFLFGFSVMVLAFVMAAFLFLAVVADFQDGRDSALGYLKVCAVVFVLTVIPFALIPSKDTIYLIAGSEVGEAVATTPEAKEILSDIQEVIRHQLNELKK